MRGPGCEGGEGRGGARINPNWAGKRQQVPMGNGRKGGRGILSDHLLMHNK